MRNNRGTPQRLYVKWHWVCLQLRFEAPNAIASGGLKWQYIAIIVIFFSFILFYFGAKW